jgi:hypothetical protein
LIVVMSWRPRIWIRASPSFWAGVDAYFSPDRTGSGLISKLSLPGSSAAWLPFLTVTPADSSNPSGTAPALVSALEAWVRPPTKLRPAGLAVAPVEAASESALAWMAVNFAWVAVALPGSSFSASS